MKDSVFLVVGSSGVVRMTKRAPSLYRNEVAVQVKLTVPDSVFRSLAVAIDLDIPEEAIIQPTVELEIVEPMHEPD